MIKARDSLLEILEHNLGFDEPEIWIDCARSAGFRKITARSVAQCPDCSSAPRRTWGQYIYYSTLIKLRECGACGLVWADAQIDEEIIARHFESAYKDDHYFRVQRKLIFDHLAMLIDRLAPRDASVLDFGGARGDLMAKVVERRPDVQPTIHDISGDATAIARKAYEFPTITGDALRLATLPERFDLVVLSDVVYYERHLNVLWSALRTVTRPGGSIIIRVPNKALLIRACQTWFRLTHAPQQRRLQSRIRFFNPEHIYILRRSYLQRRLASAGFNDIKFRPSPFLVHANLMMPCSVYFRVATIINSLTAGAVVGTPSAIITGKRRPDAGRGRA